MVCLGTGLAAGSLEILINYVHLVISDTYLPAMMKLYVQSEIYMPTCSVKCPRMPRQAFRCDFQIFPVLAGSCAPARWQGCEVRALTDRKGL